MKVIITKWEKMPNKYQKTTPDYLEQQVRYTLSDPTEGRIHETLCELGLSICDQPVLSEISLNPFLFQDPLNNTIYFEIEVIK